VRTARAEAGLARVRQRHSAAAYATALFGEAPLEVEAVG